MTAVDDRPDTGRRVGELAPIGRRVRWILAATALADLTVLFLSVLLAWNLRLLVDLRWGPRVPLNGLLLGSGLLIVVLWMVVLVVEDGYSVRNFGAGPEEFRVVGLSSVITVGLVGLTCYLFELPLSRGFVILSFVVGTPLLVLERYVVRLSVHAARRNGRLLHRAVVIGGPSGIAEVVESLQRSRGVGYHVVGACLPDGIRVEPERFPVPLLGRVEDTREVCDRLTADTVIVARGGFESAREVRRVAWQLEGSAVDLVVVPSLTDVAGPRIHMRPVAGLPLLHVEQPQAGNAGGMSKRLFDVTLAGLALVVLCPLLAVVAAVVRLQDGGPVFFRQARVGRGGERFWMLKFRSMVPDAEARLAELAARNESDGVLFKIRRDPRITTAGRFLRRYSVDELPQLVNVLRGDMSLVGPRPPLPSEVDRYADDVHRRLLVRPGLTGLWQVSGRSSLSWDESVRLDLYYVDNWSMTSDLVIIAKTVRAVVGSSGAY